MRRSDDVRAGARVRVYVPIRLNSVAPVAICQLWDSVTYNVLFSTEYDVCMLCMYIQIYR